MENQVLMVCDNDTSFFSVSIKEMLEKKGISIIVAKSMVDEVSAYIDGVELILFLISDDNVGNKELQYYLRDNCLEYDKHINFIGYPDNIADVRKILDGTYVVEQYVRPIDAKAIVTGVENTLAMLARGEARKSILVVDDSPIFLRTVKGWFENKYNVSMANSATMAITFLSKNRPDLILLDYEMPLCSGPQFMEMIKAEDNLKDIPVIFLTGKNDEDSVKAVLALRPAGYLLKSMEPEKVINYIDNFFKQQGLMHQAGK